MTSKHCVDKKEKIRFCYVVGCENSKKIPSNKTIYIYIYIYIYTKPSAQAGYDARSIHKVSLS